MKDVKCETREMSELELELHFLIARFLSVGPCREAAQVLCQELEKHKVLPKRLDWTGGEHHQTFEELLRNNSHVAADHLLRVCQRVGPILDASIAPSVAGVRSLLGSGRQSLLRTERDLKARYWTRSHHTACRHGNPLKPPHNSFQPGNIEFLLSAREMRSGAAEAHLGSCRLYHKMVLHLRTLGHLSSVYCVLFDRSGHYIITRGTAGAVGHLYYCWNVLEALPVGGGAPCTTRAGKEARACGEWAPPLLLYGAARARVGAEVAPACYYSRERAVACRRGGAHLYYSRAVRRDRCVLSEEHGDGSGRAEAPDADDLVAASGGRRGRMLVRQRLGWNPARFPQPRADAFRPNALHLPSWIAAPDPGGADAETLIRFSPACHKKHRFLISTGNDGCMFVWIYSPTSYQFNEHPLKFTERVRAGSQMICSSFSAGGMFLTTGSSDHVIRVYYFGGDVPEKIVDLESHTDRVDSIQFSHNSWRFVSGSKDGIARIWNYGSQGVEVRSPSTCQSTGR
ncbi:PREDICTED: bromodomain and WD repeat-containing protein 3-like, partial [Priapulus caudatus]|uniref:Bromodomain and WD repeat-containing protein 3-like n=1 Tax=Priapulus caudatus TaxID=37621 RepID=A0ABM1F2S8_PRICU